MGGITFAEQDVFRALNTPKRQTFWPVQSAVDHALKTNRPAEYANFRLREPQQHALLQVVEGEGAFLNIGVGHGKTLIALLAPLALGKKRGVVLLPPKTIPAFKSEFEMLKNIFDITYEMEYLSWGLISGAKGEKLLTDALSHESVVLIADEAHALRNSDSARTMRVFRCLDERRERGDVPFVAMSGTMTNRRLKEFAYIAEKALGKNCPVPVQATALNSWDNALAGEHVWHPRLVSPLDRRARLTQIRTMNDWLPIKNVFEDIDCQILRNALACHLHNARGVLVWSTSACNSSIYVELLQRAPGTRGLLAHARDVAKTYRDPAGTEITDPGDLAAACKRLLLGYYYQWSWEGKPDFEWLDARNEWAKTVRQLLRNYGASGFDSAGLISKEAERRRKAGEDKEWIRTWDRWRRQKHKKPPKTVAHWLSEEPLKFLIDKANKLKDCIIWYHEKAVAEKLVELGVKVIMPGDQPPLEKAHQKGVIALSVGSHGTGLNLQGWHKNVFACVPSSGSIWEQVLGRTHRLGQESDSVEVLVPAWGAAQRKSWDQAMSDSEWTGAVTKGAPKLSMARILK